MSLIVGLLFAPLEVDSTKFLMVFTIYIIFSTIFSTLRIKQGSGNVNYNYGISYSQSLVLFAGPFGLLIYEFVFGFAVYFHRKLTKTADPDEFTDTLFNIGSFVLYHTVGFLFFISLYPYAQAIPFGYFLLFIGTAIIISWQANILLIIAFYLSGNINSWSEVVTLFKGRSIFTTGKVALINAFLYYFVMEDQWEMVIVSFSLIYIVSKSFVSRQQHIQNELERDRFRTMAYTDFMTGLANRAMMDQQMKKLNGTEESLGIVVADIDKFKQINDTYNHAVGDLVIKHFGEILKKHTDSEDFVFRTGGEEFTLFLRGRSYETCVAFLETLQEYVNSHPCEIELDEKVSSISYTVSFGMCFTQTNVDLPMERAYICADQLLLEAKRLGRNRIVYKDCHPSNCHSRKLSPN